MRQASLGGSGVHAVAATGYAEAGTAYERGRPEYPPAAIEALIDALELSPGRRVLDLGAGTGKLTRRLSPAGARLVAVEPVATMRQAFVRANPGVPVVGGAAEAIPLRDGTVDAAVVGTAFHWFDGPAALREVRRVLRPQGRLGLVWLARDEQVDWVAQLVRLVDEYKRGDPPRYTGGAWRSAFDEASGFTSLREAQFLFAHEADRETAVARVASTSFVGTLSTDERQEVLRRVTTFLDRHPDTRGRETLALPYRADVYWCARSP
jgi:SAM-dependent methyltransferase